MKARLPALGSRAALAGAAALVALVFAVYWPGLGGGFAFDDFPNIVENTRLHVTRFAWSDWLAAMFSSPASDLQRPLAMLSFALNHYFTGLNAWPMKLTNVAIHAVNSLLVLLLLRRLVRQPDAPGIESSCLGEFLAFFTAAGWALHPINLMAVLYVVQRMELLSHTFVFLGLWLYVDGRRRQLSGQAGWGRVLAGLVPCTLLGLLAKESAVLLPLYAFALELFCFGFVTGERGSRRSMTVLYVFLLLLPAIFAVAWLLPRSLDPGAYATRGFTLGERLLTEPRVLLDYLRWTLFPDLGQLGLHHDDYSPSRGLLAPPATLVGLAALPLLAMACWLLRRRRPLAALGVAWFLCAHVLTASFIPLELVFEHRNYFASLGVCLAIADLSMLASRAPGARRIGLLAAGLVLALLAALTALRAAEWSDPVRFVTTEAAKHPLSARATYDAARTLIILGDYRPDSPHTQAAFPALERALRAPGSGILPEQAALMLAARTGRPLQQAHWQSMYAKLRSKPIGPQEVSALAALTRCATRNDCPFPSTAMIEMFASALSRGAHPEVLNIYADYANAVLREPEFALRLWREASELRPAEAQYVINQARLLISLGRTAEARAKIADLRRLGRLGQQEAAALDLERQIEAQANSRP